MPSSFEIPARRERHCEPCEHHKCVGALCGQPGNCWRDYNCMHPDAMNDFKLSDDPETAGRQKALRERFMEHGRHIGKTELQPLWCPLLKLKQ